MIKGKVNNRGIHFNFIKYSHAIAMPVHPNDNPHFPKIRQKVFDLNSILTPVIEFSMANAHAGLDSLFYNMEDCLTFVHPHSFVSLVNIQSLQYDICNHAQQPNEK